MTDAMSGAETPTVKAPATEASERSAGAASSGLSARVGQALREGKGRRFVVERAPAIIAIVATLASAAAYLRVARRLWFFGDDWDFLFLRNTSFHDLMEPHNEHWSTIPVLIFRVMYRIFGLRHYALYEVPVLAAHVVICAVLWVLMRRAGAGAWAACGGVVLMAICGGGVENLTWDFQIGFVGSVMFGLIAVLLADSDALSWRRVGLVWLAVVLALMCSGIGIPLLAVLVMGALLRSGWRAAAQVGSLPALVWLVWYVAYGRAGTAADHTSLGTHLKGVRYFWTGITNVWQVNTGIPASGFVILVLMFGPLVARASNDRLARLALSCGFGAAFLYAMTAWTRIRFGFEQATVSRYVYIATALTIPAVVWGLGALARLGASRRPTRISVTPGLLVAIAAVIGVAVNMMSIAAAYTTGRETLIDRSATRIFAAAELVRSNARFLSPASDPHFSPQATVDGLRAAIAQGRLPDIRVSPSDLLAARAQTQVSAAPTSPGLPAVETVTIGTQQVNLPTDGCLSRSMAVGDQISFAVTSSGAQVTVVPPGPVLYILLFLNGQRSPITPFKVQPGRPAFLGTSITSGRLAFGLPTGGPILICRSH